LSIARGARGATMSKRPMSTRVKICGIRTGDTLDAALAAGADLIGLVLYPPSPRNVSLDDAASLSARVRDHGGAEVVALLVEPDDALVDAVVKKVRPTLIQLHGAETPARVREVR